MVGDRYQAIFKWMGCVNGFEVLRDEGISLPLPKSFRCSTAIAERVQSFMQTYIDDSFVFKGMDYEHQRIESRAYLTRTNAALISKMIDLDSLNIPYRLATQAKVQQIFSLPLALIYLTPGKKQYNPELKYLQEDVDEWASSKALQEDFTKLKYIAHMHKDNPNVQAAVQLIAVYGPQRIIELSKSAESHKYSDDGVYLMTVHTSKGLSFDSVELADDVNESIEETINELDKRNGYIPSEQEMEGLCLYYVACSRARYEVTNAKYL